MYLDELKSEPNIKGLEEAVTSTHESSYGTTFGDDELTKHGWRVKSVAPYPDIPDVYNRLFAENAVDWFESYAREAKLKINPDEKRKAINALKYEPLVYVFGRPDYLTYLEEADGGVRLTGKLLEVNGAPGGALTFGSHAGYCSALLLYYSWHRCAEYLYNRVSRAKLKKGDMVAIIYSEPEKLVGEIEAQKKVCEALGHKIVMGRADRKGNLFGVDINRRGELIFGKEKPKLVIRALVFEKAVRKIYNEMGGLAAHAYLLKKGQEDAQVVSNPFLLDIYRDKLNLAKLVVEWNEEHPDYLNISIPETLVGKDLKQAYGKAKNVFGRWGGAVFKYPSSGGGSGVKLFLSEGGKELEEVVPYQELKRQMSVDDIPEESTFLVQENIYAYDNILRFDYDPFMFYNPKAGAFTSEILLARQERGGLTNLSEQPEEKEQTIKRLKKEGIINDENYGYYVKSLKVLLDMSRLITPDRIREEVAKIVSGKFGIGNADEIDRILLEGAHRINLSSALALQAVDGHIVEKLREEV